MRIEPQSKFSCDDVEKIIRETKKIELGSQAKKNIELSRRIVEKLAFGDKAIYGINTGFGRLAQVRISKDQLSELQVNLLRSHSSGIGEAMSAENVRRLNFLRILSLAKARSGISWPLLERHFDYFNRGLHPFVPLQGSVGASGDLAPLSHFGLTFMGEGYFLVGDKKDSAAKILKKEKLEPLKIGPKEGLSLTNGTQFSLSLALSVLAQWKHLRPWIEAAAALSVESFRATNQVFDPKVHELKGHAFQKIVAKRIFDLLKGSSHMKSHEACELVQDPYSFRCIPQVMGPAYALIQQAESLLEDELNSVSDNPLVFYESQEIRSAGHFHAQSVSFASDLMSMAMISIGNLIERRVDQLVNPTSDRLPAFLASSPGLESGLMIVQTAAAALASENKTMGFPASADTIPTNANQEDHVSMAPNAARKADYILGNLRKILAAELVCATRAGVIESTRSGKSFSPKIQLLLQWLGKNRAELFQSGDRVFSEDLQFLETLIQTEDCPI
jgi:histidine ammonia-lyase